MNEKIEERKDVQRDNREEKVRKDRDKEKKK